MIKMLHEGTIKTEGHSKALNVKGITGVGSSINNINKVYGHLEDRRAIKNSCSAIFEVPLYLIIDRTSDSCEGINQTDVIKNHVGFMISNLYLVNINSKDMMTY
jgi:hypothetical protein